MKIKILFLSILIISALEFVFVPKVYSQEEGNVGFSSLSSKEEFDEKYRLYLASVEDYQRLYEEYRFKRSQYINFQTLRSKTEAHEATIAMLRARDEVVIAYLEVLKTRLGSAVGVSDSRRQALTFRLDEEVAWFSKHKEDVTSSGTLEDTVVDSNQAKDRWRLIEPVLYEVLATVAYGRVTDFTQRSEGLLAQVSNKMGQIRGETREGYSFSARKFQILDRWLVEAQNKIVRSKEKQAQAVDMMANYAKNRGNLLKSYNDTVAVFSEAQILLKESDTFMKEIIREIKTAEE